MFDLYNITWEDAFLAKHNFKKIAESMLLVMEADQAAKCGAYSDSMKLFEKATNMESQVDPAYMKFVPSFRDSGFDSDTYLQEQDKFSPVYEFFWNVMHMHEYKEKENFVLANYHAKLAYGFLENMDIAIEQELFNV